MPLPALRRISAQIALLLCGIAVVSPAQRPSVGALQSAEVTGVHYEVMATRVELEQRRLHVTTSFDVADGGVVILSLPAWTPGAYEISDFAKWVSGFGATQGGQALRWDKVDHDSWRLRPTRRGRVTVEFDYTADTLDTAMSWTRHDFALFNGTNLFMYPEGRPLTFASTARIRTEPDFLIATGMTAAGAKGNYRAADYHELVDMPVFVGRFDFDSASISGKTVRFASYPSGSVAGEARAGVWDQLKRIIPVEVGIFGEAPWNHYTVMQIADSSSPGFSGLEHANSHVDIVAAGGIGSDVLPSLYAHEIFHSWNVKRLRPADLTPYRYDVPQPTTWLWMSEGITDYYADLAMVRGGVVDVPAFYSLTAAKIGEIASTIPFALEDASLNTWVQPKDGTAYSYYSKGSLAGLLLDIQIRDASDNKRSLDTVMRELYETRYKAGRGFTHGDWWGAVRRAANGRSFEGFERRYVDGREPYPWPDALHIIGLRLAPDSQPRIGVSTAVDPTGGVRVFEVAPGTMAASAGVRAGDTMVTVGEIEVADQDFGPRFRLRYAGRPAGSPVAIVVKRGAVTLTLAAGLAYGSSSPRVAEDPSATARAQRLRNGIVRGITDR